MAGFILDADEITPNVFYPLELPSPMMYFDFENLTQYRVLVGFGSLAEQNTRYDPDIVLKPFTGQTVTLERPVTRLGYFADTKKPQSPPLSDTDQIFGFTASDNVMPQTTSFKGVTIAGRLIGIARTLKEIIISTKLDSDTFDRFQLMSDGDIKVGDGTAAPLAVWNVLGAGDIELTRAKIAVSRSAASIVVSGKQPADAFDRFQLLANGVIKVGDGTAAPTNLWSITSAGNISFTDVPKADNNPQVNNDLVKLEYFNNKVRLDVDAPATAGVWGNVTPVRSRKGPETGIVVLEGRVANISGASVTSGQRIVTLKSTHRPAANVLAMGLRQVTGDWGQMPIIIRSTGEVEILTLGVAPGQDVSLGGISFVAA